jgi:hypothetical protein
VDETGAVRKGIQALKFLKLQCFLLVDLPGFDLPSTSSGTVLACGGKPKSVFDCFGAGYFSG